MEVGDLSGWVQGIGTVLAVSVALYYSQQQRREATDERLRAVFAWAERNPDGTWQLSMNNRTPYPLSRWRVVLSWTEPDRTLKTDHVDSEELGLLLPGMNQYSWSAAPESLRVDSQVTTVLEFVDAAGRAYRWSASNGLIKLRGMF